MNGKCYLCGKKLTTGDTNGLCSACQQVEEMECQFDDFEIEETIRIEKLKKISIEHEEGYILERYPDKEDLFDKINEIIDVINELL